MSVDASQPGATNIKRILKIVLGIIGGVPFVAQPFVIAELRLSYEAREAVLLGFGQTFPIIAFAFMGLWLLELWENQRRRLEDSGAAGALDSE